MRWRHGGPPAGGMILYAERPTHRLTNNVHHNCKQKMEDDDTSFIPPTKGSWRNDNDTSTTKKRNPKRKSSGITPKTFHKSLPSNQMKKTLKRARQSADCYNLKERFKAFKEVTMIQEYPLQELALRALEDLQLEFEKLERKKDGYTTTTIDCVGDRSSEHDIRSDDDDDDDDDALWSMEPRIFAIEKLGGKRKYIVCHLGRFMHRYWRHCEPSNRHYYELIKESTPCRLYFGELFGFWYACYGTVFLPCEERIDLCI